MGGLGSQGDEIPHHIRVLKVGLGVALLGVDERREKHGIPDEKDGGVVANQIPVTCGERQEIGFNMVSLEEHKAFLQQGRKRIRHCSLRQEEL